MLLLLDVIGQFISESGHCLKWFAVTFSATGGRRQQAECTCRVPCRHHKRTSKVTCLHYSPYWKRWHVHKYKDYRILKKDDHVTGLDSWTNLSKLMIKKFFPLLTFEVAPQQHFEPTSAPVQLFRALQSSDCTGHLWVINTCICCCVHVKPGVREKSMRSIRQRSLRKEERNVVALPHSLWALRGSWGQVRLRLMAQGKTILPSFAVLI